MPWNFQIQYSYLLNAIIAYHHLSRSLWGVRDTALCRKGCQWLAADWWFSTGTPVSSTNKTDHHDITEILLKNHNSHPQQQQQSPLTLWVRNPLMVRCARYSTMMPGRRFSPNTPLSSTNKTDRHDITEILLKVALNTINHNNNPNPSNKKHNTYLSFWINFYHEKIINGLEL